jgi:hypothetical protein
MMRKVFYSFSSISRRTLLAVAKRVIKCAWISCVDFMDTYYILHGGDVTHLEKKLQHTISVFIRIIRNYKSHENVGIQTT